MPATNKHFRKNTDSSAWWTAAVGADTPLGSSAPVAALPPTDSRTAYIQWNMTTGAMRMEDIAAKDTNAYEVILAKGMPAQNQPWGPTGCSQRRWRCR